MHEKATNLFVEDAGLAACKIQNVDITINIIIKRERESPRFYSWDEGEL